MKAAALAVLAFVAYGCATTGPPPVSSSQTMRGIASWYGEEFAGRTTANGEIFDPAQLTAAHRTLPFGTVLDVVRPETRQTVRVRVNDRGPYIGNRMLDLSYAAAREIGLIEPGIGEVEVRIVRLGEGEREPPVPFEVVIPTRARTASVQPAPPVEEAPPVDVVVDRVVVEEQRAGVMTRKQVSADGTTIEEVPVTGAFFVQAGAFSVEANARALEQRLKELGEEVSIAAGDLFRVRVGPFATREAAERRRATIEAQGIPGVIVTE